MNDEPDTNPEVTNTADTSNPAPTPKQNKQRGAVTVSLDIETIKEIDKVAHDNLRSRGNIIRLFIMSGLARAKKITPKFGEDSFADFI